MIVFEERPLEHRDALAGTELRPGEHARDQ
jgi:hypothetical protein